MCFETFLWAISPNGTHVFYVAVVKEPIDPVNMTEALALKDVTKEAIDARLPQRNVTVIVMTDLYPGGNTADGPTRQIRSVSFPQNAISSRCRTRLLRW